MVLSSLSVYASACTTLELDAGLHTQLPPQSLVSHHEQFYHNPNPHTQLKHSQSLWAHLHALHVFILFLSFTFSCSFTWSAIIKKVPSFLLVKQKVFFCHYHPKRPFLDLRPWISVKHLEKMLTVTDSTYVMKNVSLLIFTVKPIQCLYLWHNCYHALCANDCYGVFFVSRPGIEEKRKGEGNCFCVCMHMCTYVYNGGLEWGKGVSYC